MEIIPVIDLMDGLAVHAQRGLREQYRPLRSPLCRNSEPVAVLEGLLGLHAFKTVYLADLDALMGKGRQAAVTEALVRAFPNIGFWIDSGLPERGELGFLQLEERTLAVVGSESLGGEPFPFEDFASVILSLDFLDGELVGPKLLLDRPELWPERVILMSLSRVGSDEGPDFARVEEFTRRYPRQRFVAAGGVRGEEDLERLEAMEVSAVLMASALHSGKLSRRVLERFG